MKKLSIIILAVFIISCAKVSVETAKPLKVDINMRVDVYQHVVKDVEDINDQIYGGSEKDFNSLFGFKEAYAADFSQEMSEAISRRKERGRIIEEYFAQGYIGENKEAFLETRGGLSTEEIILIEDIISKENKDRKILYKAIAAKNGASVFSGPKKASFESDYKRASSGSWFQVSNGSGYSWQRK